MKGKRSVVFVVALALGIAALLFTSPGTALAGDWSQEESAGFGKAANTEARPMAVYGSRIYVGLNTGTAGCEVWSFDGANWAQVMGGGAPDNPTGPGFGDPNNIAVRCMAVSPSYLYVGTYNWYGCEVWRYDGYEWTQIVGQGSPGTEGTGPGFGSNDNKAASSMAVDGYYLYVGTENSSSGCEVWRYDGATLAPVAGGGAYTGPGFGNPANHAASSMTLYGDYLYTGTRNGGGCEVWAFDGFGWTQTVGPASDTGPGFGNPGNVDVGGMAVYNSRLHVGTSNLGGCEIWSSDGATWSPLVGGGAVTGPGFGDPLNTENLSLAVYDSRLFAGTTRGGGCEVWSFDGSGWARAVGGGASGTPAGPGFGNPDNIAASSLGVYGNRLYAGTQNTADGCELWSVKSSTTWYLAEGSTLGGYETWVLVQNPNPFPVDMEVTFQTGEGEVDGPAESIPAGSRRTYYANGYVDTFEVSTRVASLTPGGDIICERAVYWTPPGGTEKALGHDSIGVTNPASTWYLAEGSTAGGYETWVLVQNPNPFPVNIDMKFQTGEGQVPGPNVTIFPQSRESFRVNDYTETYHVSTRVSSLGGAVICERAVYWTPPGGEEKVLGHSSIGVTSPASTWYLAEGAAAGGYETWVLVQNPNPFAVEVAVVLQTEAGQWPGPDDPPLTDSVPARSRETYRLNDLVESYDVSTRVTSLTPGAGVICERAVYWTPPGGTEKVLGHDSIGYDLR